MVATTFSTDTPNLVTNLVREHGVANNWAWWAFLLTGMMTVFFYARLWRRSGVLTDLEFYEIRYSGKAASLVRGFRAVYLGLVFNCFIMATVNLAAVKIANVVLGWPMGQTLAICAVLNIAFAATSGLWGVLVTDFIQFGIAMSGAFAAAYFALQQPEVGGLANLIARTDPATLALLPDFGDWSVTLTVLIIPLTIQWWSVWYPGAEPGGGSYIAQRMLAARTENDALKGTLFFNFAHYALRPWPWIIVALASMHGLPTAVGHPDGVPEHGPDAARSRHRVSGDAQIPARRVPWPDGRRACLPPTSRRSPRTSTGERRTWSTTSIDAFSGRALEERHYVLVGRIVTALLMIVAALLTYVLDTARESFELLLSIGAGHRSALPPSLVLVAGERLERSVGHGGVVRGVVRPVHRPQERPGDGVARVAHLDGCRHDGSLDRGDPRNRAG